MSITIASLIDHWHHTTGAFESSDGVSALIGINQALSHMSTLHTWAGLKRSGVPLATVANQEYIDLPSDLDEILSVEYRDSAWRAIQIVSMQFFEQLRNSRDFAQPYTGLYYGALSWREGENEPPRQVLNMFPSLGVTAPDTFRIAYRAEIAVMGTGQNSDTGYIQVPRYMEALVYRLVSIFARSFEEEDDGGLELLLEALAQSSFLRSIMRRDGRTSPVIGPMRNGAAQGAMRSRPYNGEAIEYPAI